MTGDDREDYLRAEMARLSDSMDRLANSISNLDEKFVPRREFEEARRSDAAAGASVVTRLEAVEGLRDWAIRIVLAAVILSLLGLVLAQNGGIP